MSGSSSVISAVDMATTHICSFYLDTFLCVYGCLSSTQSLFKNSTLQCFTPYVCSLSHKTVHSPLFTHMAWLTQQVGITHQQNVIWSGRSAEHKSLYRSERRPLTHTRWRFTMSASTSMYYSQSGLLPRPLLYHQKVR